MFHVIVMNHLAIDVALKMVDSVEVQLAHCGLFPCLLPSLVVENLDVGCTRW